MKQIIISILTLLFFSSYAFASSMQSDCKKYNVPKQYCNIQTVQKACARTNIPKKACTLNFLMNKLQQQKVTLFKLQENFKSGALTCGECKATCFPKFWKDDCKGHRVTTSPEPGGCSLC